MQKKRILIFLFILLCLKIFPQEVRTIDILSEGTGFFSLPVPPELVFPTVILIPENELSFIDAKEVKNSLHQVATFYPPENPDGPTLRYSWEYLASLSNQDLALSGTVYASQGLLLFGVGANYRHFEEQKISYSFLADPILLWGDFQPLNEPSLLGANLHYDFDLESLIFKADAGLVKVFPSSQLDWNYSGQFVYVFQNMEFHGGIGGKTGRELLPIVGYSYSSSIWSMFIQYGLDSMKDYDDYFPGPLGQFYLRFGEGISAEIHLEIPFDTWEKSHLQVFYSQDLSVSFNAFARLYLEGFSADAEKKAVFGIEWKNDGFLSVGAGPRFLGTEPGISFRSTWDFLFGRLSADVTGWNTWTFSLEGALQL